MIQIQIAHYSLNRDFYSARTSTRESKFPPPAVIGITQGQISTQNSSDLIYKISLPFH